MDLKMVRESNNTTQQQLADAIGKDRSLITKIESGTTLPSVDTAKAIGKALNIDWTLFFANKRELYSPNNEEVQK